MQTIALDVLNNENQAVQDAYAILTANIHLSISKDNLKSIVITSCKPGVGKSTIAISLAVALAETGWKVLLVDADMRKLSAAKYLNSELSCGLSDYLAGEVEMEKALCMTNVNNLLYLSCGNSIKNPISLINSSNFNILLTKAYNDFDFIVFDTTPLSSVSDASLVAAKADSTLLVVEIGHTSLNSLKSAKEKLEKVNAKILGVVLNKVKKKEYKRYFEDLNYFRNSRKFLKNKNNKKIKTVPDKNTLIGQKKTSVYNIGSL